MKKILQKENNRQPVGMRPPSAVIPVPLILEAYSFKRERKSNTYILSPTTQSLPLPISYYKNSNASVNRWCPLRLFKPFGEEARLLVEKQRAEGGDCGGSIQGLQPFFLNNSAPSCHFLQKRNIDEWRSFNLLNQHEPLANIPARFIDLLSILIYCTTNCTCSL